ncbi:MAG: protein phosphatase 2C domain-containing protein [Gemmatimonadota bacterium]|nr:protein phosphatase 2C domain-containing protein [Gemmatimonadota bacterium]
MPERAHPGPTQTPRPLVVVAGGRTDVGRVRTLNEDSYLVAALGRDAVVMKGTTTTITVPHTPALLVVADGVGGAASGEIASLMATDTMFIELRRRYETDWPRSASGVDAALRSSMASANHVIYTYAAGNPQHRGMATTATLALVHDSEIAIAQVGDSRAYLVRGGVARQVTKDQSLIQRLIDAGEITEGEAANSDRRNIILQALGSEATVSPDIYHEHAEVGDVLMLCSDGLSNLVSPDDIARIALADDNMETVCERLVAFANAHGGHDNITVVAARFEPGDPNEPPTETPAEAPAEASRRGSTSQALSDRVRRWLR